ncbi:MAG: hypothetical protein WC469_01320 [Candidatus Omnitrophota bacterium]
MIKRIVVLALVAAGAYLFYKYFMASAMEPFFKQKVEFGLKVPEAKY